MRRRILTFSAVIIIASIIAFAAGYNIATRTYERAIVANTCMARYAEENGEIVWMYIGDELCSPKRKAAANILHFE